MGRFGKPNWQLIPWSNVLVLVLPQALGIKAPPSMRWLATHLADTCLWREAAETTFPEQPRGSPVSATFSSLSSYSSTVPTAEPEMNSQPSEPFRPAGQASAVTTSGLHGPQSARSGKRHEAANSGLSKGRGGLWVTPSTLCLDCNIPDRSGLPL